MQRLLNKVNLNMSVIKKKAEGVLELKIISKSLTNKQKEVIRLLQNKENFITNNHKGNIFVTCGNNTRKVAPHTFYSLITKGLVISQTESPFSYVLTAIGEIIEV